MADKLIIVLANTNPGQGAEAAAPFVQATIAAAMDYDVEILFTGRAGKLAQQGVADTLTIDASGKTVRDLIVEAHDSGVRFKLCPPTIDLDDELIAEIDDTVGAAYLISESMNQDTVTFTY